MEKLFFFINKPTEIREVSKMEANSCVCCIHSNMKLACKSLFESNEELFSGLFDINNPSQLFVCSDLTEDCYNNKCKECCGDKVMSAKINRSDLCYDITWLKWVARDKDDKSYSRVQKIQMDVIEIIKQKHGPK